MTQPAKIAKYVVSGVIGQGGMGIVYKAFDPVIQRSVAIKTIRTELLADDEAGRMVRARFDNEAQAAGRLSHPGIVAVYDYGETAGFAYIVMEYIEGESLRHLLGPQARLPERDIVSIMVQLLDALDYAHEHGVWHRDIKPPNLLLTKSGKLKVSDFGIARIESTALTRVNVIVGTPGYMAPEQFADEPIDGRVDLFAAGVLFYEMLAGQPPFTGSDQAVMLKVLHERPQPPAVAAKRDDWSRYDPIVLKALEKSPKARFGSAAEFREAIVAVQERPPAERVANETVVLARSAARSDASPGQAGSLPMQIEAVCPPAARASTDETAPAGWDAVTLSTVERELARLIGPVAKILVRRAATQCHDVQSLKSRLADHLSSQEEVDTFLQLKTGARPLPGTSTRAGESRSAATGTTDRQNESLTPEALERLTQAIVTEVGPIGKTLARKAAATCSSRTAFIAAVTGMLSEGGAALRDKLLELSS